MLYHNRSYEHHYVMDAYTGLIVDEDTYAPKTHTHNSDSYDAGLLGFRPPPMIPQLDPWDPATFGDYPPVGG